jgi:hypothetical protein
MKLVILFGLIGLSLIGSLLLSRNSLGKRQKTMITIIKAIFFNFFILGLGSLWWFLTETDGLSQGIGVLIYFFSMIAISLIDITVIIFWLKRSV